MLCFSKPIESAFGYRAGRLGRGFSWRPLVRGVSWEIDGVVDIDVAAEDGVVEAMLPGAATRWGVKLYTSARASIDPYSIQRGFSEQAFFAIASKGLPLHRHNQQLLIGTKTMVYITQSGEKTACFRQF